MKNKILILFIAISLGFSNLNKIYGQETISYIKGTCLGTAKSSKTPCLPGINTFIIGDTLNIYGTIEANCCGVHLAEISKRNDSILILTKDTGALCKCLCNYCFEIKILLLTSDTIVMLNNKALKIKKSLGIDEIFNEQINIFPNPTTGDIKIIVSNMEINGLICEVYSPNGKKIISQNIASSVVDLNISSLLSGNYIIGIRKDFKYLYKQTIIKK